MGYCQRHGYFSTTDGQCPGCKSQMTFFIVCPHCGRSYPTVSGMAHICPNWQNWPMSTGTGHA